MGAQCHQNNWSLMVYFWEVLKLCHLNSKSKGTGKKSFVYDMLELNNITISFTMLLTGTKLGCQYPIITY